MIFPIDHFNILSSRDFTWNNNPRENPHPMGIVEESDLRCKGFRSLHDLEKQVYDDACDKGFAVRSERTGTITLYAFYNRIDNPREPGEIQVWVYRSVKCVINGQWRKCERTTEIHVLND